MRESLNILLISATLCLCVPTANGQESSDFSALRFDGGQLYSDVRIGANLFGSGLGSGSFGRIHSSLQMIDGAVVFGNPASLAHVSRGQIGFEGRLPMRNGLFGLGPSSLLTERTISAETDAILADLSFPLNQTPVYTRASHVAIGQPRQLSAFWLTWPVNDNVGVGFGYRQPLFLSSKISMSGASAHLRGNQSGDGSSIQIDFVTQLALSSDIEIQLDEISIGAGGLLERYYFGSVWWGISFYRYAASAGLNLDVVPQGLLTISGSDQYFFNDAEDPNLDPALGETNSFYWKVRAGYRGGGIGARIGLIHRTYGNRFGTSVLLNIAPRITMQDGDAFAMSFLPVFVNLEGVIDNDSEANQDLLDIEALDLTRPNLTRQTHDDIGKWMIVHLPTSLAFGVDLPVGRHNLVINVIRYWGSLAIEGQYGRESGQLQHYKIGKEPTWGLGAGIDFVRRPDRGSVGSWDLPLRLLTLDLDGILFELMGKGVGYSDAHYRIAGGIQWGDALVQGLDTTIVTDIENLLGGPIFTSLSIGRSYSLFDRLDVGVHVAGVPDLLLRYSLALNFD